jgi:ABC-type lipoprotein export system ATPase subunit
MKKIDTLELRNFKAFRNETFVFGGKHALIYGNNGSGKSSLFWALYTFLQSSGKHPNKVREYFVPFDSTDEETVRNTAQSLVNVFAPPVEPASISLTWVDDTATKGTKTISSTIVNTNVGPEIKEANLASDFINYKLLQNFYNNTHKQEIDLWDVFQRDIFPYFEERGVSYRELIATVCPNLMRSSSTKAERAELEALNENLALFIGQIMNNANTFLRSHFYGGKDVLEVKLVFTNTEFITEAWVRTRNRAGDKPIRPGGRIRMWVRLYDEATSAWRDQLRPHSFLNEAQLTRVALAVRIGALQTRVQTTDFKILCLDDMLISLDMSNRDQVIKLLLNYENEPGLQQFDEYQKVILTHDRGFYNIIRRYTNPQDWNYFELSRDETGQSPPVVKTNQTSLERAEKLFADGNYEDCALQLRKELESEVKWELKQPIDAARETLTALIKQVKNQVCAQEQQRFDHLFVNRTIPVELLKKLNTSFATDTALTPAEKGQLTGIQKKLNGYLIAQYETKEMSTRLMNKVQFVVDFYLNPSAHSTTNPTYQSEIAEALAVVKELKVFLALRK